MAAVDPYDRNTVPGQPCYDADMASTRWDPLRDLLTLHEQIGQLVGTDAPGHGRFSRAFMLPEPIDVDAVAADFKDGLLTLTMPKADGRGARRVDVT